MPTRVLSGPAPIATPADIAGKHTANDPAIIALIAAVQAEIDGPVGWLGRALGVQKLEFTTDRFPGRDPGAWDFSLFPKVIPSTIAITFRNRDGVEQTIDPSNFRLAEDRYIDFRRGFQFPATECAPDAVKIIYEAGYNGTPVANGGTGDVPANAKVAVVLGVQQMKAIGAENLFLRSEEVEGVGTFQYTVSEQAGEIIRKATDRLLSGLRVYA
ncbi:hypothetical protein JVX98_28305 [Ensifer sp. PDNC004]|uniref:hypothetical protein n=1 Tax=Ensifer sp. PDNC004 TaxID=2811423 RepID=UPI0019654A5B|nr:hypothetical protein [Ensifer sp. PDNC004]QRY68192.1 hypothetical protein JVX98_28305 [Ensifer sp. PDNC004]